MADKTTTSLTAGTTPLAGSELAYIIQGGNSRKTTTSDIAQSPHTQGWGTITSTPTTLGGYGITDAATSAQGALADSAVQPGDLATVATSGDYADLINLPTLGTAAATAATDYATAAQGATADSALQPGDIGTSVQAQGDTLDSLESLSLVSGDILYATGADTLQRLPKGTDGQILNLTAGIPAWATVSGTGDMVAATYDPQSIAADAFDQDNMTDGAVNKNYTGTEQTKLAGIATGATANSPDATLLDRANHTGTQAISTVSGLQTALDGKLAIASNLSDLSDAAQARENISVPVYVATRTAMKALDTTKDVAAILLEGSRSGLFKWTTGDFSAEVTADTEEGVFVKATAIAATSGAWVRFLPYFEVTPEMFGAAGDGVTIDTTPINKGVDLLALMWGGGKLRFGPKTYLLDNYNPGAASTFDYYAIHLGSSHAKITLEGAGRGATKLILDDLANCTVIQLGQLISPYDSALNVTIRSMEIDGNRDNQDAPEASTKHWAGIMACHNSVGIVLEDMYIHHCQYYGIGFEQDLADATLTGFQNCHVRDVVIEDTGADGMDCKDFRHNSYGNTIDNLIIRRTPISPRMFSGQARYDLRSGWSCRNIRVSEFGSSTDQVGIRFQVSSEVTTVPVQSSSLEDFTVKGDNGATNIGIRALQFGLKIGRGKVTNCQDGVSFSYPDTRISEVTCSNNVNGFKLWQSTPTSQEADVASCFGLVARDNTGTGLIVDSVDECSFLGCDIRGNLVGVDLRTGCNSIRFLGGSLSGNTTNLLDPDNAGKFEQVSGFRTANRIISSNVLIDSTGTKGVTLTHNLAVTPALSDVSLTVLCTSPVGDWSMGFLWVTAVSSTTISAQIRILTASATAGAFVNVMATVKAKNQ